MYCRSESVSSLAKENWSRSTSSRHCRQSFWKWRRSSLAQMCKLWVIHSVVSSSRLAYHSIASPRMQRESVTVAPKRTTNVSVTKRPCDHGVKPPCPPCSSTNLTNIATSPCPPCSLTNIANMVTSHCPPCSLTNSTVITTIMYGTKIMYLNPKSLLR